MRKQALLAALSEVQAAQLKELRRCRDLIREDEPPNAYYNALLKNAASTFIAALDKGAFEPDENSDLGLDDGASPQEMLARLERVKTHLLQNIMETEECDGSA